MPDSSGAGIDKDTGIIFLQDGFQLGPSLTAEEFLASTIGARAELFASNEPWTSYRLRTRSRDAAELLVILRFCNSALLGCSLIASADLLGDSWEDYSQEKERACKEATDAWLLANGVNPNADYLWGSTYSRFDYDVKAGYSSCDAGIFYNKHSRYEDEMRKRYERQQCASGIWRWLVSRMRSLKG